MEVIANLLIIMIGLVLFASIIRKPLKKQIKELREDTDEMIRVNEFNQHERMRDRSHITKSIKEDLSSLKTNTEESYKVLDKRMKIWEQEIRDRVATEKAARMFRWIDGTKIQQATSFLYRGIYIQDGEKLGFQIQLPHASAHIENLFMEFKNPSMCSIEALSALLELYAGFVITGEEAVHIQPAMTEEVFEPTITEVVEETAG